MTFEEGSTDLLAHLRLNGYSPATIHNYSDQLKCFGEWLRRHRIGDLRAITRARLLVYQTDIRKEPISRETQALRIRAVKRLYGHLVAQGHLVRLWKRRVGPGESTPIGLYRAESEDELEGLMRALPLYEWMHVDVTSLEPHPNDPAAAQPSADRGAR